MSNFIPWSDMTVELVKNLIAIMSGIATMTAIVVGGVWAYLLFVRTRQKFPRANIAHKITHHPAGDHKTLIHVDVTIRNVGDVLLSIVKGQTRVQQIYPIPGQIQHLIDQDLDPVDKGRTEINWPLAGDNCERIPVWKQGEFEIEPNESDEVNYDFIVNADIKTVEVYSYFTNARKRNKEIGWNLTTLYELSPDLDT